MWACRGANRVQAKRAVVGINLLPALRNDENEHSEKKEPYVGTVYRRMSRSEIKSYKETRPPVALQELLAS